MDRNRRRKTSALGLIDVQGTTVVAILDGKIKTTKVYDINTLAQLQNLKDEMTEALKDVKIRAAFASLT